MNGIISVDMNAKRTESLKQQSECVTVLRALVEVLETEGKPLYAHSVRRGANRMVRLEATIIAQQRRLERYQHAADAMKKLGDLI